MCDHLLWPCFTLERRRRHRHRREQGDSRNDGTSRRGKNIKQKVYNKSIINIEREIINRDYILRAAVLRAAVFFGKKKEDFVDFKA